MFSQNVPGKSIHAHVNIIIKNYKEGLLINASNCFITPSHRQTDFDALTRIPDEETGLVILLAISLCCMWKIK